MNEFSDILILIVEDSATQAEHLRNLLQKQNYRVNVAANGHEALKQIDDELPDLVISDILMPEMNGYQLCAAIRANKKTHNLPVVLLTSLSSSKDLLKALECGADNFVTKPFNDGYFIAQLQRILHALRQQATITEDNPEIIFGDERFKITAGRQKILDLLVSTYETTVNKNKELHATQKELREFNLRLEIAVDEVTEAKQEAEAATRAKSQFLANMSHEIRTPMNAVLGLLHLLRQTELSAQQKDYVEKVQGASKSLLAILNDILDISKIEAGKVELELAPFNLKDLLRNIAEIFITTAQGKGLGLTFTGDIELPFALEGDVLRLQQILSNLVSNAIKFTSEGEVTVGVRTLQASSNQIDLEFSVSDTGIGIAQEALEFIFEDFSQAESSTSRRFGGTGLGLAISKQLVALMGGELDVESEPARGSVFRFRIRFPTAPLAAANASPLATDLATQFSRHLLGLRLLVVDDNQINQQVAEELLTHEGATVRVADSGRQGIELLIHEKPFDAVLLDIQMPDMDGYEVTREIRETLGMSDLPIIAMTANVIPADRKRCLDAGMDAHIGKPIDVDELVNLIHRTCGREVAPAVPIAPEVSTNSLNRPGFEFDLALQRLGNNQSLLARMAREFESNQNKTMENLRRSLKNGDLGTARQELHTLKGVAATLGAKALADAAAEAGKALKTSNDADVINTLWQKIEQMFDEACSALLEIAGELEPPVAEESFDEPLDRGALVASLKNLEELLSSGNMRALPFFQELNRKAGSCANEKIALLDEAIQQLNFSDAAELCRNLFEELE